MKQKLVFTFLVLFFLQFRLQAQKAYVAFKHVTLDDGLSSNMTRSFCKDKTGFVWIGTNNGLNRYDGYAVKNYMPDPSDTNTIRGRMITGIKEDSRGQLWITSEAGLERYNPQKDKFYHYFPETDTSIGKGFEKIIIDKVTGHIWLLSNKFVLIRFDPVNNKIYRYKHDPKDPASIGPTGVMQFLQEEDGTLWMALWNYGITRYNRDQDNFTHFLHDPNDSTSIINEPIYTIATDGNKGIWASTFNSSAPYAIARLDQKTGKFKRYKSGINGAPTFVYYSTMDLNGNVWFAALLGGLYMYDYKKDTFIKFTHKSTDNETISESVIATLYTDYNNTLWVGTLNKGANFANLNFKDVVFYPLPYQSGNEEPYIGNLIQDDVENIWIGSTQGLYRIDKKSNEVKPFILDKNKPSKPVYELFNYIDGNIITTNNDGLYEIDIVSLQVKRRNNPLPHTGTNGKIYKDRNNNIWVIYGDNILFFKGGNLDLPPVQIPVTKMRGMFVFANVYEEGENLWIGFYSTFLKININTLAVTDIFNEYYNPSNVVTTSGFHMQKGRMIFNSPQGRLAFNVDSNKFYPLNISFLGQDELVPKAVFYTEKDILFSTYRGLFLYNTASGKFSHPAITHNERINPDFLLKTNNGKVYLPSNSGFLTFRPDRIEELAGKIPSAVIEDFYLFNKVVKVDQPGSPLKTHINYTHELMLDHTQTVFSLGMTLLNFDEVQYNQYAYILEGFEKEWNYVGQRRIATYTNIPAGEYTFKFKVMDKNGTWSFMRTLKVIILPPFWETWWFRLLIIIVSSITIYGIIKIRTNVIKKQKVELEHQVILRTTEINQQKEEILTQQEKIYEIYNELTDSIQTSKRIQDSILPEEGAIKKHFKDAMVFFRPKDIVSGDFYWMYAEENRVYVAAADCTGHGVSGAFMSFIGYNILNKIIEANPKAAPDQILKQLNTELIKALHQESENPITRDGMDISLCCFQKDTLELQFAGANNPLYVISNGKLEAIKADKNSIGIQPMGKVSQFVNQTLTLAPGDAFYIFSDGLMSQFGSDSGEEKFKHNRFRDLLVHIYAMPMQAQRDAIETSFMDWKRNIPQTDDIMVLGMKV